VTYRDGTRVGLPLALAEGARSASRCSARWDADMMGCGRARYCWSCGRDVYDIASLSAEDAKAILGAQGAVRARLYVRQDGTVMRADCPVGVRQARFRRALFASWAILACALVGMHVRLPRLHADAREVDVTAVTDHAARVAPPFEGYAVAGAGLLPLVETRWCPDYSHSSGLIARLRLPARATTERLRTSTVTVCFNRKCASADLAALPEQGPGSVRLDRSPLSGSQWPAMFLSYDGVALNVRTIDSESALSDGDIYGLTVRPTSGGSALVRWRERATYTEQRIDFPCPRLSREFRVDRAAW
jgi:hypothetical protein